MSKDTKTITSSVNLPVSNVKTIINVEDRRFEIPIEEAIQSFKEGTVEFIKTLNTTAENLDHNSDSGKYFNQNHIEIVDDVSYINNIEKREINDENFNFLKENIKFYRIHIEYSDGRKADFDVPSYVKFYSMHKGQFVPVEQLKSRDILMDYAKRMVKVEDAVVVNSVDLDKEYYNIKVTFERQFDEEENVKEYPNLYINGVLVNIAYMNFNKSFSGTDTNKEG